MKLAHLSAKQLEKINGTKYEIGASSALLCKVTPTSGYVFN